MFAYDSCGLVALFLLPTVMLTLGAVGIIFLFCRRKPCPCGSGKKWHRCHGKNQ